MLDKWIKLRLYIWLRMKVAFLQDEQVYTCVYIVSHVYACECLYLGRPKRQRTFLKFEWKVFWIKKWLIRTSITRFYFILFEEKERKKNTHPHIFTHKFQKSPNILLHFEFIAWIMFGQTKTYFTTRQSISLTLLQEYAYIHS